ncbi:MULTISPECIES: ribonuclease P protein component [Methylosinus]|uniref:Ribonuclease P protein component n=1 Tax=Methylosinus trichosporium (strain ATCC 35070 / NCIMB 11131 / UNIQEM 75 / OB3b) TaxID=595536 RepID=A0A2D2CYW5_METT3|nr:MULTISPECIES: ribonuclease P protein component [Methylosinus]ATQ67941.1 ribonuclease P protein component [Methylosinus trichosporium OB3b]OBS53778.1 ribonuclease P protein component [Methylosinus sp. 3S-1]
MAPAATTTARPERLRRRREFLRAAKSGLQRSGGAAFKLQAAAREGDDEAPPRFGLTVTKKVAGAVGRNRIRRRLREALRLCGAAGALPGYDYVFIARPGALTMPFAELEAQMAEALAKLRPRASGPQPRNSRANGPPAS